MELTYIAMQGGVLRPATARDTEQASKHWKPGQVALVTVKKPRNGLFHRKLFALLNFLFEYWECEGEYKGIPVEKNFDKFREDITIAAGFHETYVNAITGELRLKAKSISFASMDEAEFEALFNAVINIGLKRILPKTFEAGDVRKAVENELMGFA